MEHNNGKTHQNSIYNESVLAGKRKYFFDIRQTRDGDYYITIKERKRQMQDSSNGGGQIHSIFLYKEDLNKFMRAFTAVHDKIKELLPSYDFTQFDKREDRESNS